MKVELHLHTSRYSGCATATPAELMRKLIETGYQAVYITEHDAVWREEEIARLQEDFPAIRIFPGVELSLGTAAARYLPVSIVPLSTKNKPNKLSLIKGTLTSALAKNIQSLPIGSFRSGLPTIVCRPLVLTPR